MIARRIGAGFWRVLVALLYLFLLGPLLIVLIISFDPNNYLSFPPQSFSFRWYLELLDNEAFVRGFRVSLILAAITTLVTTILAVPAALAVSRYRFRGAGFFVTFFTMPLMIPAIVLGLGLLLVLSPLRLTATYPGLLAAHIVVTLPFVVRTVATSLMTLAPEYEEAALSLGATPWRTFWRVTFPLIRPGVIAGAAIAFLVSFDEVVLTLFLVGPRLTTLPVEVFHYVEYRTDPQVAALSVVIVAISLAGVMLIERVLGLRRAIG